MPYGFSLCTGRSGLIHDPSRTRSTGADHGPRANGWQALGWQRLNGLDAPMPPAEAREEALAGEVGAASVSEAMQDAEAEPSIRAKTLMERLIARLPNCRQTAAPERRLGQRVTACEPPLT